MESLAFPCEFMRKGIFRLFDAASFEIRWQIFVYFQVDGFNFLCNTWNKATKCYIKSLSKCSYRYFSVYK